MDKDKWYDFRAMFRRDKNFWNYNLLANPLNPTTGPIPRRRHQFAARAGSLPPHAGLRSHAFAAIAPALPPGIFPQRQHRPRVHHHRGRHRTAALANRERITNSYRMGVDYRGLSKTTLSFDELLTYSTINNSVTDNNLTYQLSNGTPVDLGLVFIGTSPCAITAAAPPDGHATCNAYLSYSQVQNPRSSFPVERFSFQSAYFKNLAMSGSASYSSGNNTITGFNEDINGWSSRTLTRGSTTGGPAQANRVSANANWSGDYRVTDKLDIVDEFSYDNWRIPSMWATAETNLFDRPPAGQTGMLLLPFYPTPVNLTNFATAADARRPITPRLARSTTPVPAPT